MSGSGYPKFGNDRAVAEIRIGVREFNCIGVSPPHHHPHVYINMGAQDARLCPYCARRFRFEAYRAQAQSGRQPNTRCHHPAQ